MISGFADGRSASRQRAKRRREGKFVDGRNEVSPGSEQIEHSGARLQVRNSVSVKQISNGGVADPFNAGE